MNQIATMTQSYEINTAFFKGPIELLYSLIQKNSLDINEISLSLITEDFLLYLEKYKELGHYEISEFIDVASQLIYLKSIKLLPFEKDVFDYLREDDRINLVDRLISYHKMKKGFDFLKTQQHQLLYERGVNPLLTDLKKQFHIKEITLEYMIEEIKHFLSEEPSISLSRGEISLSYKTIEEQSLWFLEILKNRPMVTVFELFKDMERTNRIVSFVALLELAKQRKVDLFQEIEFDNIFIKKVDALRLGHVK